jgi:thymidylate synthase ThyX
MNPGVRLVNISHNSFNMMVAAARTCYSPRGIIGVDQVAGAAQDTGTSPDPGEQDGRHRLARSIYRAGHHTTLQHGQAQFALEGVSRLFIWSFLHGHPFYNSEQVSQRYVPMSEGHWVIPRLKGPAATIYREVIELAGEGYWQLASMLEPEIGRLYGERFPSRSEGGNRDRDIARLCGELARYVLPLATTAYLYHTVSILTLFRYHRLCLQQDAPAETRQVVAAMVAELLRVEPDFAMLMEEPIPLADTPEAKFFTEHYPNNAGTRDLEQFRREFDSSLGGLGSRLVAATPDAPALIASSVREVLGLSIDQLGDDRALDLALSPGRNTLWGETLNLSTLDRLARPLYHASFSFRRRLSHSADSQDQRHRMTPASRPSLLSQEDGQPDYTVPALIREIPATRKFYDEIMERIWKGIARFRKAGGSATDALYLLPNAKNIRYTESTDLLNFRHKAAMRLCYNAQDEIWRLTIEESRQISELYPQLGRYLRPPCGHRQEAGSSPRCPEGDRFCGVKAWDLPLDEFERSI